MDSATSPAPPPGEQRDPPCPLRPGALCAMCVPGAAGPDNCGLVYLVMSDPELHARLDELRARAARAVDCRDGRSSEA